MPSGNKFVKGTCLEVLPELEFYDCSHGRPFITSSAVVTKLSTSLQNSRPESTFQHASRSASRIHCMLGSAAQGLRVTKTPAKRNHFHGKAMAWLNWA